MIETPGGSSARRREPDDPAYVLLEDFKRDLREVTLRLPGNGRPPEFPGYKQVRGQTGIGSVSTVHAALTDTDPTMPSEDTVRLIAQRYAPDAVDDWILRRHQVEAHRRGSPTLAGEASAGGADTTGDAVATAAPGRSGRRAWVTALVVGFAVVIAGIVGAAALRDDEDQRPAERATDSATGASPSDPSPSESDAAGDVATPPDYSDPNAAGCVEAGSTRLENEPVDAVDGLVSLVYSPACDAYWARAERADGLEVGNRIQLRLTARGSSRAPVTSNDADAAQVYSYLLTGGDATGFCVEATFSLDQRRITSPRLCHSRQ